MVNHSGIRIKDSALVAARKIKDNYSRMAKRRGHIFELTDIQVKELIIQNCHYCGIQPSSVLNFHYNREPFLYNGIDRVDNEKGYTFDNVVPCCSICNYAKKSMSKEQFLQWIKRIYINQYRKVTNLTPGQLIDLLFTTDYKCWWAQEKMLNMNLSEEERADEARKAQEYNAKRTKLIRTIDDVLDFSEDTNTEKTYSDGIIDKDDNHTYFNNK